MPSALLRPLAAAGVGALLLAGCSFGSGSDDDAAPAPSTTTTYPTPAGPTVVGAGAEPRTELRLHLTAGTTTSVRYTTDLAVVQATGLTTQGVDPPPVTQTIAFEVGAVDGSGAEVTFRVTDVLVAADGTATTPAAALTLQAELAPLVGIGGRAHLSDRGHLDRIAFDLPAGVSDAVRTQVATLDDQLGALVPTLPEEPVGVGARWTASGTTTVGGLATRQVTTYTLTGATADEVTFTSTTAFTTEPQDVDLPGLPAGTTARLVSSELAGTARGTMALDGPAHTLASTTTGTQVLDLTTAPDPAVRVSQRVQLATRVRAVG